MYREDCRDLPQKRIEAKEAWEIAKKGVEADEKHMQNARDNVSLP